MICIIIIERMVYVYSLAIQTRSITFSVGKTFSESDFSTMISTYNACREYSTVEMAEVLYVHCLQTLYGRYIAIQLSGMSRLFICEIEI